MTRRSRRSASAEDEVRIRVYRNNDLRACRDLWRELVIKHREIYVDASIGGSDPGKFFDVHLKKTGRKRIWVAEEKGRVVGFVGLVVEGEDAEIEPLIVTKDRRGRGVGRKLAKHAMMAARSVDGVKFLTVRPVARNKEALEFFRRQGLVNVGSIELFTDFLGKEWKRGLKIHDLEYGY